MSIAIAPRLRGEPLSLFCLIEVAKEVATLAHSGQIRKNTGYPYISHPREVANQFPDTSIFIKHRTVAWLHDVVEDTSVTLQDLRDTGFPNDVVLAVDALTRREEESYLDFILRCRRNKMALSVKIADIRHNMSDLYDDQLKEKYLLALHILTKEGRL